MAIARPCVAGIWAGALCFLSGQCLAAETPTARAASAGVIAQAGSITLAAADIRTLVGSLPDSEKATVASSLDSLEQVVHADLVQQAMLADAKAGGFDRQPETVAQLDHLRDEALVRLWIASKAAVPAGYPSEAEVQTAYSGNQQALATPAQYHLAQIFISAPDGGDTATLSAALHKATDISSRIATADFAALSAQQSTVGAGAGTGPDLGYVPENRMMPGILSAVRSLKPGQTVGPIKTSLGLHFLKLIDKKPGTTPTLAEAHDRLVTALRTQRANQLAQAYLRTYDAKLGVTVNQIELARLQQTLPR